MEYFILYLKQNKTKFFLLTTVVLLYMFATIPIPYFSKFLIDNVLIQENYNLIWIYIFLIFIVIFLQTILGRINAIISANFYQSFLKYIRNNLFSKNIITFYNEDKDILDLQTIIFNDSELYVNNIEIIITTILNNSFIVFCYSIILIKISYKLFLIILIFVPIYILWIFFISKKIKLFSYEQQKNKDNLLSFSNKIIHNISLIKIYDYFNKVNDIYCNITNDNSKINIKKSIYQNYVNIISSIIICIASSISFILGVFLIKKNEISIGSLIAFNSYSSLIFNPITQLINLIYSFSTLKVYKTRISKYLSKNNYHNKQITSIEKIYIQNLQLKSGLNTILNLNNLILSKGSITQIKGENGSGKTILLKSISNLYHNYIGNIIYLSKNNEKFILKKNIIFSPNKVIYLSHNQKFILNTIKNEIESSYTQTDESIIWDVLDKVNLKHKIESLNLKLDTEIKYIQENLSTGEIQRLQLARALLKNPDFLILDEALSNVDENLKNNIMIMLKKYYFNIGIILVDHNNLSNSIIDNIISINDFK